MSTREPSVAPRRSLLGGGAALLAALTAPPALSDEVDLRLPDGNGVRALTDTFPSKGRMIVQRTRPPLLETPFEVFDEGVFTPNDRFFVRWHWAVIPTEVDVDRFRLTVRGNVDGPRSLTLRDVFNMPKVEMAAVNQCSGNSRGLFQPRVPGAQWSNGAMGNAKWGGVRLRDLMDRCGVKAGTTAVRFGALDQPVVEGAPDFMKSLAIDHARDGEVMIAYQMNGEQLPLLNGFPLRLIVPGWFSTYWVKAVNDIEVLTAPDETYWMKSAYRVPDTPFANVRPGQMGFATVPISRMGPRSFFTNAQDGGRVQAGSPVSLRGIAFGGTSGVKAVDISTDDGASWRPAALGADEGRYGFRRWSAEFPPAGAGAARFRIRCTNDEGIAQPLEANWNGGGFMRNVAETLSLQIG